MPRFNRPIPQPLSPEARIVRLQKKYDRIRIVVIVLALLLAGFFYVSYDYLVFKLLIGGNYVYTETLDAIYKEAVGEENVKGYLRNFDQMVISVVTAKIRSVNDDRYTYLYTPVQYKKSIEYVKTDAELSDATALTKDIVYVKIPNISKYTKRFVFAIREEMKDYSNVIIDLRSNYGGMLWDFYAIADLFLEKGDIVGYEITRLPFLSRTVRAKNEPYFNFDQIVILQDDYTASASEGFIMALRENLDNVVTVGETTYGKGIGQVTIPLTAGYAVKATVLRLEGPENESIHRIGIPPDVACESADALDAAMAILLGTEFGTEEDETDQ